VSELQHSGRSFHVTVCSSSGPWRCTAARERNLPQNRGTRRGAYAHDPFTERAVEFIQADSAPFFLHVSWTIPHANNELGRDTGNGLEAPPDEPYTRESWPQVEKNFAAMISRMDRDVGRLLAALFFSCIVGGGVL
jgi:arylsulfatase A-like enzyme